LRELLLTAKMSVAYRDYVDSLSNGLSRLYAISEAAHQKGLDPSLKTESIVAQDIADLVEGLVGPKGVAASIRDLSTKIGREEIAFKVAEQIVSGEFGELEPEKAAEQAIRTALAIFTEGLTAAPIQGVAQVKIKMNPDRSKYLAIYFAGPIRSAGGTDQALTLVVGDYVRRLLNLDRYKPMPEEVARFIEELRTFERQVGHFQYHIPDDEVKKAFDYLTIEVTGTESDPVEVSSYRNLPRIETNRVRGGALRVINDGIVGRALKVHVIVEKLGFQGWDWLREFKKKSEKKSAGFMDDVIAGRPIFAFPSRKGGFRLRYGRSRNTGLSAVGIHPATMLVLENFLAAGTQVRLELPGKGGVTVPVDSVEPPVVLLKDGSVVKVTLENFKAVKGKVEKILFLGDMLIAFGDFLYCNKQLSPSGYVEEWWAKDLRRAVKTHFEGNLAAAAQAAHFSPADLERLMDDPFTGHLTAQQAIALSQSLHVPLHPRFTFFWSNLTATQELTVLKDWLSKSQVSCDGGFATQITGSFDPEVAKVLRKIYSPYTVAVGSLSLAGEDACALAFSLGYGTTRGVDEVPSEAVFKALESFSGVEIRDKAPSFVGARMGRPEKAKHREMKPAVQVLFPVGLAGGSHRDLVEAGKHGPAFVDVNKRKCPTCKTYTFRIRCSTCGEDTVPEKSCPRCGRALRENSCPTCKADAVLYQRQSMNFKELVDAALRTVGGSAPKLLRGVKGMTNLDKMPEVLEKGILRARHGVYVYKDGTIRFDATNAPLTHIKPSEVGVSVEKLRQLGYTHDIHGAPLTEPNQVLELKVQDIVIPSNAAEYLIQIAAFIDDLLTKVYKLPACYGIQTSDDLVGQLVFGLAPHTCVGILGRVVGYTDLKVIYAHPLWHSAKRRDCDGDEDAIMLAMDTLLNFSNHYLPAQIGGIMDAPILVIPFVNTKEVQRQAHDFDVDAVYPDEFYTKSMEKAEAKQVSAIMDVISHRLGTEAQFEGFNYTTPVTDIGMGNTESSYKLFKSMVEKLHLQLELGSRIDAVDVRSVALKVLTKHFLRDISGNLRAFSTQAFRCRSCNRKFRRLPLNGKCPCGGVLTLTVYRGGIEKYLEAAQELVDDYALPKYYTQRIAMIREEIHSMFDNNKPKQTSLFDFDKPS
jgi:DNA polymerase II large subunit